jgi:hypothetical protein
VGARKHEAMPKVQNIYREERRMLHDDLQQIRMRTSIVRRHFASEGESHVSNLVLFIYN